MYAVVETGGKQYRLAPGDTVTVERLRADVGASVDLGRVLLVVGDDGAVAVGTPTVEGARVRAEVLEHGRHRKILVFKYKPKVNYRRRQGHRQPYTRVRVTEIAWPGAEAAVGGGEG
ncbi:MAG: 50S ribosomal protein L21 [Firmicutes bacterium]|nr:50S ribosomal protein L21 [Bacillota bacterium]